MRIDPPDLATAACAELAAEVGRLRDYADLLERGLSSHEARATVWGDEAEGG